MPGGTPPPPPPPFMAFMLVNRVVVVDVVGLVVPELLLLPPTRAGSHAVSRRRSSVNPVSSPSARSARVTSGTRVRYSRSAGTGVGARGGMLGLR
jgi:hypothetical protein